MLMPVSHGKKNYFRLNRSGCLPESVRDTVVIPACRRAGALKNVAVDRNGCPGWLFIPGSSQRISLDTPREQP